jgi:ABC-type amino acid transport substrate-binding protein
MKSLVLIGLFLSPFAFHPSPLRWGGDAEGGAPFVEADPMDPSKVRGFDVDVADEIAKGLGRRAAFAATIPYYEFREVLTVRAEDRRSAGPSRMRSF